ncbi:MAG: hypothetical protein GX594_07565 [Pirellulaceae bacterium]|nr:hypothetical protein [Pirellulaceae bacterium]
MCQMIIASRRIAATRAIFDPRDRDRVFAAMAKNFRPGVDVAAERFPADPYDPLPPTGELTDRMAIDATRKL